MERDRIYHKLRTVGIKVITQQHTKLLLLSLTHARPQMMTGGGHFGKDRGGEKHLFSAGKLLTS